MQHTDPRLPKRFNFQLAGDSEPSEIAITEQGRAIIDFNEIELSDFNGIGGSCREMAIASLMLLREQIDHEIDAMLKTPGGTGAVSFD